ncbi:hypothetical protein [Desulfurobacterium sp.]
MIMDAGIMTTLVAGVFGALGMVIGFVIGRMSSSKPVQDYTPILRGLESTVKSLQDEVVDLTKKISLSTEEILEKYKEQIEAIISQLEDLKTHIGASGISIKSAETIDSVINQLKESLNAPLPSVNLDDQVIMKIKDKIDIIRAEVESIKLSMEEAKKKEEKTAVPSIDTDKIKEAINMAREINEEAVKGDLISLMYAFKEDDKKDLLKSIDEIALNSKQLVLILEDLIKSVKERKTK